MRGETGSHKAAMILAMLRKVTKSHAEKEIPLNSFRIKLQNTKRSYLISLKYQNFTRKRESVMLALMLLTLFVLGFNMSGLPFSFMCK